MGSLAFYIYLTILGVSFFFFLNRKTLLYLKYIIKYAWYYTRNRNVYVFGDYP